MMRKIIRHLLYLYIEWERKSRFSKKSMLKDIKKGGLSCKEIGDLFGVSKYIIYYLLKGVTYKNV